jgi:hypothetical protein
MRVKINLMIALQFAAGLGSLLATCLASSGLLVVVENQVKYHPDLSIVSQGYAFVPIFLWVLYVLSLFVCWKKCGAKNTHAVFVVSVTVIQAGLIIATLVIVRPWFQYVLFLG